MAFLTKAANRGSIATGYDIDNSLKFESNNSEHLHRTPGSAGNTKTWTYSVWFKRTELGLSAQLISALDTYMYFETNDQAWLNFRSGGENFFLATNRVFRDTSAWYHAVIVCDVTDSTAADRAKLYINGVRETSYANSTYQNLDSNDTTGINAATVHRVGAYSNYGSYFNGYMAEAHLIDGQALDPTYFGEFDQVTGIWKPKEYTGTYGTNGFYLDFSDGANLGDDASGNGNNFTEASITSADQATDTPTNNFCTFNPLQTVTGKWVVSNGATSVIQGADYGYLTHAGNMGFKKGKWYAEFKAGTGTGQAGVGMNQLDNTGAWENSYIGAYSNSTAIGLCKSQDGYFYRNGGSGALGVTWTAGDILGIAIVINADGTGFLGMSKNGTWENSQDPSSGTSGMLGIYYGNPLPDDLFHSFAIFTRRNNGAMLANFGGYPGFTISSGNSDANGYGTFEYAPPSGYYALCTKNLEEFG